MNFTTLKLIGVSIVVVFLFGGGFELGRRSIINSDNKVVVKEQAKEIEQTQKDEVVIQKEASDYVKAINVPIDAPMLRVRYSPCSKNLPSTGGAISIPNATPAGGTNNTKEFTWDSGPVVRAGVEADAKIRGLQAYIRDVCLVAR